MCIRNRRAGPNKRLAASFQLPAPWRPLLRLRGLRGAPARMEEKSFSACIRIVEPMVKAHHDHCHVVLAKVGMLIDC
jgi:hypothetical protein